MLLAFLLRTAAIDRLPPGLSHDEAYNGVTAMQLLEGNYRIFYEINKGIEPLIIYLEAAAFALFGIDPVSLRLVNLFFGMLTVALVYPLAARLLHNRRMALLAMAGVAVSFWAVFVSRLTLRAVLLPPFLLLTIYFFWRGVDSISNDQLVISKRSYNVRQAYSFFALGGVAGGITMYTYLSSRFAPLMIGAMFLYLLVRRKVCVHHWIGLLLCFFLWAAIFTPLVAYFVQNSDSFTHRADQVTTIPHALEGDLGPLMRNSLRTLGMFTFRGDTTDRYNLDGRPIFDWGNGLLFYLGLGLVFWRVASSRQQQTAAVFLFISLFFMLLPDLITDDSPHFLRTIGALPVVYIFWAVGLDAALGQANLWRKSAGAFLSTAPTAPAISQAGVYASRFLLSPALSPAVLAALILSLTTLHTAYDYFGRWANSPNGRYIYGADIAEITRYLKTHHHQDLPAISAEYYRDLDQFRFALHFQGQPPFAIWFDGRQTLAFPPPGSNLSPRYIFPISAPAADIWTTLLQPSPEESGQAYKLYRLPEAGRLEQYQNGFIPIGVNVNNDLILSGYRILGDVSRGEKLQVLLNWQALRTLPPGTDYTFLVQMRDGQDRARTETDGNGYDPGDWQPGVSALQLLTLHLPESLSAASYQLTLQVVDRQSGQALPMSHNQSLVRLNPLRIEAGQ